MPSPLRPPPRLPALFVHTDEQWDAITSAPRLEIVQFLTDLGPASLAQLALALARPADGLYHHARRLLAAGLVRQLGARRVGPQRERLYDVAADRLVLDVDVATGRNADRFVRLARVHLEHASELLRSALDARLPRLDPELGDTFAFTETAWLDDAALAQVRHHLAAIRRITASRRARGPGALHALTIVATPAIRSRNEDARPTRRMRALKAAGKPRPR
ncbi:MAG: hypothetical protein SFZ24_10430 [Planctomycetota bacterium]|nr:hypothetical protein [Planctomycetota bacterium]